MLHFVHRDNQPPASGGSHGSQRQAVSADPYRQLSATATEGQPLLLFTLTVRNKFFYKNTIHPTKSVVSLQV